MFHVKQRSTRIDPLAKYRIRPDVEMGDSKHLTPREYQALMGVSRETLQKLEDYVALVRKWQTAINLVAQSTLRDIWRRHILESAQLLSLIPKPGGSIIDLGSGAGFPGLVLAILGAGQVQLRESNSRKCVFMREVIRVTGAPATVEEGRIESLPITRANIVTARALAPLDTLLFYAEPLVAEGGFCLFLKGRGAEGELTEARKGWKMQVEIVSSQSESAGRILKIGDLKRAEPNGSSAAR